MVSIAQQDIGKRVTLDTGRDAKEKLDSKRDPGNITDA